MRVVIMLDVDDGDTGPLALLIWATLWASRLAEELWQHGIIAHVRDVNIDADRGALN